MDSYCLHNIFTFVDDNATMSSITLVNRQFYGIVMDDPNIRVKKYRSFDHCVRNDDVEAALIMFKSIIANGRTTMGTRMKLMDSCLLYDNVACFNAIYPFFKPTNLFTYTFSMNIAVYGAMKVYVEFSAKYPGIKSFICTFGCEMLFSAYRSKYDVFARKIACDICNYGLNINHYITCYAPASAGDLATFTHLVDHGFYMPAENYGSLSDPYYLWYVNSLGLPIHEGTALCAVQNSALECIKFLGVRKLLYPANATLLCNEAAMHGNIECLKLLRSYGIPWSDRTFNVARENGKYECAFFILDNGCPVSKRERRAFTRLMHPSLDCVDYPGRVVIQFGPNGNVRI